METQLSIVIGNDLSGYDLKVELVKRMKAKRIQHHRCWM